MMESETMSLTDELAPDILSELTQRAARITGSRRGKDLWLWVKEIYDRVERGDWTVEEARLTLGLPGLPGHTWLDELPLGRRL
jgi:hypothetical protein